MEYVVAGTLAVFILSLDTYLRKRLDSWIAMLLSVAQINLIFSLAYRYIINDGPPLFQGAPYVPFIFLPILIWVVYRDEIVSYIRK